MGENWFQEEWFKEGYARADAFILSRAEIEAHMAEEVEMTKRLNAGYDAALLIHEIEEYLADK